MKNTKRILSVITASVLILSSGCDNSLPDKSEPRHYDSSSIISDSSEEESSFEVSDLSEENNSSTDESSETDTPAEEKKTHYSWAVEPSVDAEDVSVLYHFQPGCKTPGSYELDIYTVGRYNDDDYTVIKKDGKYGLVSYEGKMLLDCAYDHIVIGFGEKLIAFNDSAAAEYFQLTRKADGTFTAEESMDAQLAMGTNGRSALLWIDEESCLHQTSNVAVYNETRPVAAVVGKLDGNQPVPDYDESTTPPDFDYVFVSDNKRVDDVVYENGGNYCDGIIPFMKDGCWGYLDENGNTVIPFEYDDAFFCDPFNETEMKAFNATCETVVLCKDNQYMLADIKGEEIIPFGEFEQIRPVYKGKAWVKKDGKWGVISLDSEYFTDETENNVSGDDTADIDLTIETAKLTDSDIKPEWNNIYEMSLEYPIFKSSDKELEKFLDENVTQKILSYIATESEYEAKVMGGYNSDLSFKGYLSINGTVCNRPYMSNGASTGKYSFCVDLKNKKVLRLKDLFSNGESEIYREIAEKTDKYAEMGRNKGAFFDNALMEYDYSQAKFNITNDKLIIIFDAYEVAIGAAGAVSIEIPVSDIYLKSTIDGFNTVG